DIADCARPGFGMRTPPGDDPLPRRRGRPDARLHPRGPRERRPLAGGRPAPRWPVPLRRPRPPVRRARPPPAPRGGAQPGRGRAAARRLPGGARPARCDPGRQRHRRGDLPAHHRAPSRAYRRPRPHQLRRLRGVLPLAAQPLPARGAALRRALRGLPGARAAQPARPARAPRARLPAPLRHRNARHLLRPVPARHRGARRPGALPGGDVEPRHARRSQGLPALPPSGPHRLGGERPLLLGAPRPAAPTRLPRCDAHLHPPLARLRTRGPAGAPGRTHRRLRARPGWGGGISGCPL
ncbi:MAG: Hydrolase, alpha/beta fold family, partial [uncultured Thermomicrobiales bacterium]